MSPTGELTRILNSPKLPQYAAVINQTLFEEAKRRQQFYRDVEEWEKAEFIEGEVVMQSPASDQHQTARLDLAALLKFFCVNRGLSAVRDEKSLCVFPRNDYEPDVVYDYELDIVFFDREKAAKFPNNMMKFPIPDFVVEILSDSTESRDRGIKFEDFETHGVREYWIVEADDEVIEQYVLKDGQFQLQLKSGSGEIESVVIKGFRIPIRAMFDREANLAAMDAQAGRTN